MTVTAFDHVLPWTEEEYLALGETSDRVELFDGSLYVSPAPTPRHQNLSAHLWMAILPAARSAGMDVYQAVNVRLRPGRIAIPDLVVVSDIDPGNPVVDVEVVRLVAEIVSPTNAATDRVLKMHYYAEAGIPWYLLVDPDPVTLTLFALDGDKFALDGDKYVPHATAGPGEVLRLTEPVTVEIDPGSL